MFNSGGGVNLRSLLCFIPGIDRSKGWNQNGHIRNIVGSLSKDDVRRIQLSRKNTQFYGSLSSSEDEDENLLPRRSCADEDEDCPPSYQLLPKRSEEFEDSREEVEPVRQSVFPAPEIVILQPSDSEKSFTHSSTSSKSLSRILTDAESTQDVDSVENVSADAVTEADAVTAADTVTVANAVTVPDAAVANAEVAGAETTDSVADIKEVVESPTVSTSSLVSPLREGHSEGSDSNQQYITCSSDMAEDDEALCTCSFSQSGARSNSNGTGSFLGGSDSCSTCVSNSTDCSCADKCGKYGLTRSETYTQCKIDHNGNTDRYSGDNNEEGMLFKKCTGLARNTEHVDGVDNCVTGIEMKGVLTDMVSSRKSSAEQYPLTSSPKLNGDSLSCSADSRSFSYVSAPQRVRYRPEPSHDDGDDDGKESSGAGSIYWSSNSDIAAALNELIAKDTLEDSPFSDALTSSPVGADSAIVNFEVNDLPAGDDTKTFSVITKEDSSHAEVVTKGNIFSGLVQTLLGKAATKKERPNPFNTNANECNGIIVSIDKLNLLELPIILLTIEYQTKH